MYRSEEEIKRDMLNSIKNTEDKTQNSLIHDALSPASLELANFYLELESVANKLDVENLEGEELERFVYQRAGINRRAAIKASTTVVISGSEGINISNGDLVSTGNINFVVVEDKVIDSSGQVVVPVECEQLGTIGNVPANTIDKFPVAIPGATSVINLEPVTSGYDAESDYYLRQRYYESIRTPATSGNKYHYINWAKEVSGVGEVRIDPLWNGNGTVKVIIIDSEKNPAPDELVEDVSNHIEEERPIGADVTVVSAISKPINIQLTTVIDSVYTLEQIKQRVEENIDKYLKETAFKVDFISYARIGKVILETEGILDYSSLTINNGISNIPIEYEEVPVLGEVIISE